MEKLHVEIFTGNCPLCDETVLLVKEVATVGCEVVIYDLRQGQEYPAYLELAKRYGVNAVPAIAINEVLVLVGKPTLKQLEAVGIAKSDCSKSQFLYLGTGI